MPDLPDKSLAPILAWAQARLDSPLTIADLARRASVSPATLHRRFRTQGGTTPLMWLTGERLALTCRLIERGESRFEVVARLSGLGTATSLRALMRRETGTQHDRYDNGCSAMEGWRRLAGHGVRSIWPKWRFSAWMRQPSAVRV